MRWILIIAFVASGTLGIAQRDLTPNSKKQAFGKRDLRALSNYGLQIQVGATYLMSRLNNPVHETTILPGFDIKHSHDPKGLLGAYAEIGMFHFPKKRSKLSLALKTVLVSYYDWGLGFKYFAGTQNVLAEGPAGHSDVPAITPYRFSFGHVYGRFSLHKNIHFKTKRSRDKSNFFLDNSLGINVDYRVLTTSDPYVHNFQPILNAVPQRYSEPLHAQLHYGLGFGFRLKRGAYLIPGVRTPLLSFQTAQPFISNNISGKGTFGNPSFFWFSNRYWPILIHVKYMFAFEKKQKGCPPVEINDQDRNTQQNR